ncbi:hypothetical protein BDZ97DRAFT_1761513 [Flammula alnicola]|nr:hypothetical protein BDZ97DRAFT_1761513 [Flammula alnicola]
MQLLNLPPELIVHILYELPPSDLLACQLTNKYLSTIIGESVVLQYNLALTMAKAEDNPYSYVRTAQVTSLHRGSMGVLANGFHDVGREGEDATWKDVSAGKMIVDIGLCVYENDLMALVMRFLYCSSGTRRLTETFDIEIDLLELSTKKPHPQAQKNPICHEPPWDKLAVGTEIINRCLIFLNEELILLPNTGTNNSLDIFRISKKPTLDSLEQILILRLPVLADGRILDAICLFELRIHVLQLVMLAGGGLHTNFQFRRRFTFVVHRRALLDVVSKFCDNGTPTETLDSPLHPSSSSEVMGQTHIGGEGPAMATTRQRCVRMPNTPREDGDRYFVLDFNPENVKMMAKWLKTQPSSMVPEDGAKERFHDAENGGREDIGDFEQLSNVFVDEHMETEEQEEEAFITPDDANASSLSTRALSTAQVIDAESENESDEWVDAESEVSSVADEQEALSSDDPFDNVPPSELWCATEPGQVGSSESFAVPVLSALPYVACASIGKYKFDGVLLDEERVIGIHTYATGNIEQIDIHHFG